MSKRLDTAPGGPALRDRDPSRVHWMELFFDLIFVALIGQLAHGLHEEPTVVGLAVFLALFASVWWSWVNLTFVVNASPDLTSRGLGAVMMVAMFAVGAIAVAAPEAIGERAPLFAAGNAVLRLLLLALWLRRTRGDGAAARSRVLIYNGMTALLWMVSAVLPAPVSFALWALALIVEVAMLVGTFRSWGGAAMARLDVEHLSERFGLLVIIVLGESVLTTVAAVNTHWSLDSAVAAALALAIVAFLAWSFFFHGADALRAGLDTLRERAHSRAIRDIIGFLPYPLLAGVTVIAGAIAVAIHHPGEPLPRVSAVSLCAGVALYYFTNALIAVRLGDDLSSVSVWATPAVALPLAIVPIALALPALAALAAVAVALAITAALTASLAHRRRRGPRGSEVTAGVA